MSDHTEHTEQERVRRQQERKKQVHRQLLILAVSLFLILGGAAAFFLFPKIIPTRRRMSAAAYYGLSSEEQIAVIVNEQISETKGLLLDGEPYLDYESTAAYVNPSIYYEKKKQLLLVSGPTEITEYPLDGELSENGDAVFAEDGTLYLSRDFVRSVTAAEIRYYEDPGRLVVMTNGSRLTAAGTKEAPVRWRAGIRSAIICDLQEGEKVSLLDTDAEGNTTAQKVTGWSYVMTEDGYRGYVKEDALTADTKKETLAEEEPLGTWTGAETGIDGPVQLVFHQTTNQASNQALSESLRGVTGVNVLAPTWFFIDDTEGSVQSLVSKDYVKTAHKAGMKVWAVLNDFDGGIRSAEETAKTLSSYEARQKIIAAVTADTVKAGADGINVDIELVRKAGAAAYHQFIREMSAACRKEGLVLSVCTYVPTFTKYLNRAELSRVADYVVTMCYDEHTGSSKKAGSVSSIGFVRNGLEKTLQNVPAEKLLAAIPFFTRLWESAEDGTVTSSRAYGMSRAAEAAEKLGLQSVWDGKTAQHYAEKTDGTTTYQIWFEDADSIREKIAVIAELNCAGTAAWKLGLETSDIWEVVTEGMAAEKGRTEEELQDG
ncbi:MAG: glycosyl hydrolase family 18 protein [Lachnospiraceae bacterium]|nr:glycosyl hydrolase family 18 protein [Lachnospiraceae bacterium]